MVKIRKGWYLVDIKEGDEKERNKNEKEAQLQESRIVMMKQCDDKITQRQLQIKQREALKQKKLLYAQKAIDSKRKDVELTHKLAAELSQRKNEEIKRALELRRMKFSSSFPSTCTVEETRLHMIEDKICQEANQSDLLKLWNEDDTLEKLEQTEKEKKKQNLRNDLQNQLARNRRRIQEERKREKNQDRKMLEQEMQKIQEEDMNIKNRKIENKMFLRAEIIASLAAKKIWQMKYKKALKDEDEKITRIVAEKEAEEKNLIKKKAELRIAREAAIDKIAKEVLDDAREKRECEEMHNKLYEEEQRSKWARESAKIVLKKQCAVIESFKEMKEQQKAIAKHKAKNDAMNAAFARYLIEGWQKDNEKQRKYDEVRRAKNIQYGKELKDTIINNRISYAMNILERQSEICIHNQNV